MQAAGRNRSPRLKPLLIGLVAIAISVIAYLWIAPRRSDRTGQTYLAAKKAFERGNHEEVLAISQGLIEQRRDTPKLLLMAGESASRLKRYEQSIEIYDRIPDSAGRDAAIARWAAGEVTLQMGQMTATIGLMNKRLRSMPAWTRRAID